jgi:hypothetical protein
MLDPVSQSIVDHIDMVERERLAQISRAWGYYQDDEPKQLFVAAGQPDDNVMVGSAGEIVDLGVAHLFGEPLLIRPENDTDDGAKADWLDEALKHAATGTAAMAFQKLATNGGVSGHAFAKVMPRDNLPPRIIVLDPSSVTVDWSQDDQEDVWRYRITWTTYTDGKPGVRRQTHARADNGRSWEIVDEELVGGRFGGGGWKELGRVTWKYDWCQVMGCQNLPNPNEFYGRPDLTPTILSLCDAVNRSLSSIGKIVRTHGFPKPYIKGKDAAQYASVGFGSDRILTIPNVDTDIGVLQAQSDIAGSLDHYDRVRDALFEKAHIVSVARGRLDTGGQLTGRALQIMYRPTTQRVGVKRLTYGSLVEGIASRMLILGGKAASMEDAAVNLQWPNLVPSDITEDGQELERDLDMGIVSRQTVAEKRGYDWEQEQDRLAEEDAQALDTPPSDPLLDEGVVGDDETDVPARS